MRKTYEFISPLRIEMGVRKKKKVALNLNNYRNWHYIVSNNIKKRYKEIMRDQMQGLKMQTPIKVTYYIQFGDNRSKDVGNFKSVIEKFFLDALVQENCIKDDTSEQVPISTYIYTGIEKGNESCRIVVEEI